MSRGKRGGRGGRGRGHGQDDSGRQNLLIKLSALVGSLDLSEAAGTVAMTVISGSGLGELRGPVRHLGSLTYVVLEVSPLSCRPVLRGYTAGIAKIPHEVLIGSRRLNSFAYDLSGTSEAEFPKSPALALTAIRMLQHMANGQQEMSADEVELPEMLVQVEADVLERGANSEALKRQTEQLKRHLAVWPQFRAPITGQVIEFRRCEDPEFSYLTLQGVNGQRHDMLVPTAGVPIELGGVDAGAGIYPTVETGQQLIGDVSRVPHRVLEDFAWRSVIRNVQVPGVSTQVAVVPLRFVAAAIRRGTVQPIAMYEDVERLCQADYPNPAPELVGSVGTPQAILGDESIKTHALARFRHELGEYATFGTDQDLLAALTDHEAPLSLSRLACVQHWRLSDAASMLLHRDDCYADLQALRHCWERPLASPDLVPVLRQADEAARQRTDVPYAAAALEILQRYPTLCTSQISHLELLSRNRQSEPAMEYMSRSIEQSQPQVPVHAVEAMS